VFGYAAVEAVEDVAHRRTRDARGSRDVGTRDALGRGPARRLLSEQEHKVYQDPRL
jgi:hypothetical protein